MTSKAIAWMQATRSLTPDRPFMMYYAQSASHPPHTPPADWLKKDLYKGVFDDGWDKFRETTLEKQIELGIVPPGTEAGAEPRQRRRNGTTSTPTRRRCSRARWRSMRRSPSTPTTRSAAWSTRIDELGELDNTLFFYIFGDNGGSIVGDLNGCFVEWSKLNDAPEDIPYLLSRLDEYGGPNSYPNYAVGWAMAGSTPLHVGHHLRPRRRQHRRDGDALAEGHQGQG